jgi:hypothetical protein
VALSFQTLAPYTQKEPHHAFCAHFNPPPIIKTRLAEKLLPRASICICVKITHSKQQKIYKSTFGGRRETMHHNENEIFGFPRGELGSEIEA